MNTGEIYITVEDFMKLTGGYSRPYARRKLLQLRKEIGKGRHSLTIGDYCRITGDDYSEIFAFLRGRYPAWLPTADPSPTPPNSREQAK